jgi:hypothetical protein
MSIYTHQKFLRDNPALCELMDGGHRRRTSLKGARKQQQQAQGQEVQQHLQKEILVMHHMQQMQQNLIQQQQQVTGQNQMQMPSQNQVVSQNQMFDMSALTNNAPVGGGDVFSSALASFNNSSNLMGNHDNSMNLMNNASLVETRRASLGSFYLPKSTRRGSGFSIGGLSTAPVSSDFGQAWGQTFGNIGDQINSSSNSLEKFVSEKVSSEKVSSVPTSVGMANATFDDVMALSNTANQGGMGNDGDQAKLAMLEEMLAKEHMKQFG